MVSTLTWLDYSEHDRRTMQDAIDLLRERTTRDELGIGSIRDAFADMLFPGTTTIQTVAKYFLLVPWMYLQLEKKRISSKDIAEKARRFEFKLAESLKGAKGTIGRRAGEKLQRLASNVYWQGLLRWEIRVFPGSQDAYHRSLDRFYRLRNGRAADSAEFDGEGGGGGGHHNWHANLAAAEQGFPENASLKLTRREADYLRERILTSCPDSLLAAILRQQISVDGIGFAWHLDIELPEKLAERLQHAQNFSEVMHGAQLLYNLILAEMTAIQSRIADYRERLEAWRTLIESHSSQLNSWDRSRFWATVAQQNPRVTPGAKSFVNDWIDLVLSANSLADIANSANACELIKDREFRIKRSLARTSNKRARDLWGGAAGSEQLDLRWRTSQRILADILQGLEVNDNA
ncbi:MAG: DUF6361 family protein [Planctomycetaceae bacterium]